MQDDLVTLTGADTDQDGLDNRFDNNNSTIEGTSARMGNGGTTTGDPTPGSITTVQRTLRAWGCATDRDWRCHTLILSCNVITFKAALQGQQVQLNWTVVCKQQIDHFLVERSVDMVNFSAAINTPGRPSVNEMEAYSGSDNITGITNDVIYYRLRSIATDGKESLSNIIAVRRSRNGITDLLILPNPVRDQLQLSVQAPSQGQAHIYVVDGKGRTIQHYAETLRPGSNTFTYPQVGTLPTGIYYLRMNIGEQVLTRKFSVIK
jgi:hypothetical protein